MTRKFIGYFRLVEACERPGCPVCRCVVEDGQRHLDALLYEQVNDPDTRRRLRAAWGLCNWHTWTLARLGTAKTGAAIIYEDLLRVAAGHVDRLRDRRPRRLMSVFGALTRPWLVDRYRNRARCPVCLTAGAGEARYIDTAVEFVEDPQFACAYTKSAGLCVPHVLRAVEQRPGRAELGRLVDRTIPKWGELRRHLDGFVRKHEYQNREPISEEEAAAPAAAFEMLAGAPGVFGNDLHSDAGAATHDEQPAEPPVNDDERDEFERGKLELRVGELTRQLGEVSSRAAALHYRLSRVAEDRSVLELNVAGERGANVLSMNRIAELERENAQLRAALLERGRAPTERAE